MLRNKGNMAHLIVAATISVVLASSLGCSGHNKETVIPDNPEPLPPGGLEVKSATEFDIGQEKPDLNK